MPDEVAETRMLFFRHLQRETGVEHPGPSWRMSQLYVTSPTYIPLPDRQLVVLRLVLIYYHHSPVDRTYRTVRTGPCVPDRTYRTVRTGPCVQDRTSRTVRPGQYIQDRTYRTVRTGPYVQDRTYRTVCTGPYAQDRAYGTVRTGPYVQDRTYRTVRTGPYVQDCTSGRSSLLPTTT